MPQYNPILAALGVNAGPVNPGLQLPRVAGWNGAPQFEPQFRDPLYSAPQDWNGGIGAYGDNRPEAGPFQPPPALDAIGGMLEGTMRGMLPDGSGSPEQYSQNPEELMNAADVSTESPVSESMWSARDATGMDGLTADMQDAESARVTASTSVESTNPLASPFVPDTMADEISPEMLGDIGGSEESITAGQLTPQLGATPAGGRQAGSQADSSDMESMITNSQSDYVPTPEEQAQWAAQDQMDPRVAKQRQTLEEFQNALSAGAGGLLNNGQVGKMSFAAQGLVNHVGGGNFGQVKPEFRMTPDDVRRVDEVAAQQGISAGMEDHRFGGNTVAREDGTGRPGFFNANDPMIDGGERPEVDPLELASAEDDLTKKGYIKGPGGFRPSPGRFDEVRSMTGRKAQAPGMVPPPKAVSGAPTLQQRQANVAARGMSRGLQRDFDRGNQTPQSAILSQLDKGGDNPLAAGVMHGNDGYVAALKAKGLRDHDAMMIAQEKAKMDAALSDRGIIAGGVKSGAPGAIDAFKALPPDPGKDPVGYQRYKQQEILAQEVGPFENSQQGYVQYMNKAAAEGRNQNEAMRIWQAAGRQTGRASDGGALGQFGNWLMGDRPRAAGGGAGLRGGADILNDAGAAIGAAADSAGSLLNPKRFSGWAR